METFPHIIERHARSRPDRQALEDLNGGLKLSYAGLNGLIQQACHFFKRQGLKPGDIVSIVVENSWIYAVLYFAGLRYGCIINPFPTSLEAQDLARYLQYVDPKLIIATTPHLKNLASFYDQCPVFLETADQWGEKLKAYPDSFPLSDRDWNQPACLYYSSGTTGSPKGVLYSHKNMIRLIASLCEGFRFTENENHLILLPLGHTASINYSLLPCVYLGARITIAESYWSIRRLFWDIIESRGITYLEMVPTTLFALLNTPDAKKASRDLSSLKWIGCGSAPLPKNIQENFEDKWGVRIGNLYGLSETGPTHVDYPLQENWKRGTIGVPLSVNQIKIVNEQGDEKPAGEAGIIAVKGENVFVGYYKNGKLYDEVMKEGFFLTGDLGYVDQEGVFYFLDRTKDLIIKGGVNILPGEIDEILFSHPTVAEAATIGVPDKILGENIHSFVSLKSGMHATEEDIMNFLKKYLSEFKLPHKITFIPQIPKGPSGKLLRRELRQLLDPQSA